MLLLFASRPVCQERGKEERDELEMEGETEAQKDDQTRMAKRMVNRGANIMNIV